MENMVFTPDQIRTIFTVLGELWKKPYAELNEYLGSETIYKMRDLYHRMRYAGYCEEHHIRYEDMDIEDFVNAELEIDF